MKGSLDQWCSRGYTQVKLLPMEWRPKTKTKPGKYLKVILEEEAPKFLMRESEGYDDLIRKAEEMLWQDKEKDEAHTYRCTQSSKLLNCFADVVCVGERSLSNCSTASKVSTWQEMKGVAEEQIAKLMPPSNKKSCSRQIVEYMQDFSSQSNIARPPALTILSAYIPRVPYVDEGHIKFKTESVVGSGSFGTVYHGSYQGTPAAIKKSQWRTIWIS
ncbi:hypothetical protein EOD39_14826 [Acipenser ruthenus]|uniref:Uncharacterized protein n=1 Tax=Acipenser ruthenus TaxID=7906 RepID=A0A662YNI3_ACIRT|nr:hypothetical protein EOD39_14826 [Acipenser ruthenus]